MSQNLASRYFIVSSVKLALLVEISGQIILQKSKLFYFIDTYIYPVEFNLRQRKQILILFRIP